MPEIGQQAQRSYLAKDLLKFSQLPQKYPKTLATRLPFKSNPDGGGYHTRPTAMVRMLCGVLLIGYLATEAAAEDLRLVWNDPSRWAERSDRAPEQVIKLGHRLFFDPGLSGSGHTACATCHSPEFAYADPLPVSILDNGKPGPRNAISLLNVAYRPRLMWDGRFVSLEEQAFGPFRRNGEMGIGIEAASARISNDPTYRREFLHALGEPPTPDGIVGALAAFERTLVVGNSRFDRFALTHDRWALNRSEWRGWRIFIGKGHCVICHTIYRTGTSALPLFTDFGFHNTGVGFGRRGFRDLGRAAVTQARKDAGVFRTPSLRNVAVTGPYMHDGSLATLDDVVEFYDAGGQPNPNQSAFLRPLGLTEREKRSLVEFLYSLTDQPAERPH